MKIRLPKKLTNLNLDVFISDIYKNLKAYPNDKYLFDLSAVEYIGNQELLVLSALLKSFVDGGVKFEVQFFQKGVSPSGRIKKQIVEIWEVWKIWKTVPDHMVRDCFGIDARNVDEFKRELRYYPSSLEIFRRHGVTPFITLDYINNYTEGNIQKLIKPIYRLTSAIEDLLARNNCYHPFTSHALSTIITEELYLNFLDHAISSTLASFPLRAFMSISFHPKLDEDKRTPFEIQEIHKINFESECLKESLQFFYDASTGEFRNRPYIEFSFLDFGNGIAATLKEQYQQRHETETQERSDSDILRYAFNHFSSRHPLTVRGTQVDRTIPRGLFDAITIVRRYSGMLVVRSNCGKILFDFSDTNEPEKAFRYFGDTSLNFPGTLISLYIPAIEDTLSLDTTTIKPAVVFSKVKSDNIKYVSLHNISVKLAGSKEGLYGRLISELRNVIQNGKESSLVFVSFENSALDRRVIKKTIYFLLTDYEINNRNNVVILNSPPMSIVDEIASEVLHLNAAIRNYKLHPLPFVDLDGDTINVRWLGIYDDADKELLNSLLYEEYSIARSDLNDPANVLGHLNSFDSFGNLISNFPSKSNIIDFYRREHAALISKQIAELIEKHDCIHPDDGKSLYLCSGNYYQKEYVELSGLFNDENDCAIVAKVLFEMLHSQISNLNDYNFISVTTTSHKILRSLELQGKITRQQYTSLESYQSCERELVADVIDPSRKYVLICHAISSGILSQRINMRLKELGSSIEYIGVLASILDPEYEASGPFLEEFGAKIISLFDYPIKKYRRDRLEGALVGKTIIRINPFTNIPVRSQIKETRFRESVLYPTFIDYNPEKNEITLRNDFLERIDEDSIHVGPLLFNNVIHPYFFKTRDILSKLDADVLADIFTRINNERLSSERICVCYPRESAIEFLDFDALKSVLRNQAIERIEIERFSTTEGWKFPHGADYPGNRIENGICLILDDGSCSGDSVIQMVDELAFYDIKEIVLVCFVGRVKNHKREFFSRLSHVRARKGRPIPISIYFVSHWHIPTYYLDDNPNSKEIAFLNSVNGLYNTPEGIKVIVRTVLKAIKAKRDRNLQDHKYLPRVRDTGAIPKKDLLLVREEVGKAIGHRLYQDSFSFFDSFIRKYQQRVSAPDRYKEVELLCATFVYEPYLYSRIIDVLPDVVEKIEEFVSKLIFDDTLMGLLTYEWNGRDIIHLFFVVFQDEKLVQILNKETYKRLTALTKPKSRATEYILYKMLNYFPLKEADLIMQKHDRVFRRLIADLLNDPSTTSKEIKKFSNFISTLPSRYDFSSQLSRLNDNYRKQQEPEFHVGKASFGHSVSLILAKIRSCGRRVIVAQELEISDIEIIRETWLVMTTFLNPILEFSITFGDYLLPYPRFEVINKVESGTASLRALVGFNEDVIFSLHNGFDDAHKLKLLEGNIVRIQTEFKIGSIFHKLISKSNCKLFETLRRLMKRIEELGVSINLTGAENVDGESLVDIPEVYAEMLLVRELSTNIKNHSNGRVVNIACKRVEQKWVAVVIENEPAEWEFNHGSGEGTKGLSLLAKSPLFGFRYNPVMIGGIFRQTLQFRIH